MNNSCIKCNGVYKLTSGSTIDTFPPIEPYKCNLCGHEVSASVENGEFTIHYSDGKPYQGKNND